MRVGGALGHSRGMDDQVLRYVTLVHILSINLEKQMCRLKDFHLPSANSAVCSIAELPWELGVGLVLRSFLKSADDDPRFHNRGLLASGTQTPFFSPALTVNCWLRKFPPCPVASVEL